MEKICKNCKYWEEYPLSNRGECYLLCSKPDIIEIKRDEHYPPEEHLIITTINSFGCNQFEETLSEL